eukprot:3572389-Ditylum_brightwellii.AAC.2
MGCMGTLQLFCEANANLATSQDSTYHLDEVILGCVTFDPHAHSATMETRKCGMSWQMQEPLD